MRAPIAMFLLLLSLVGCGAKNVPLKHSATNPLLSASSERADVGLVEGYDVTLKKEALSHLFLLGAAQITTLPAASGSGLAHKLVFFERQGDDLYMFESRDGKAASISVDSKILLAQFRIVKEDEQTLTFDFKQGMSKLFIKRGMTTSGRNPDDTVLNVTNSYISKAESRGDVFFIDQIVRVDTQATTSSPSRNISVHMKFTLRSYSPNPNFNPKESSHLEKVGHFEIHPTIEHTTGKSTTRIMKFDTNKPVVFYLSSNIPAKHRKAVEKGVLYWNKAFETEVLQVRELPSDVSIHEPGYHILQWLDWDTAGYAYADMTGDPLTGEILQAHVYMTSTFAVSSLRNAKRQYRRYLSQQRRDPLQDHFEVLLGLQGFDDSTYCRRPFHPSLAQNIAQIISLMSEKDLNEDQDSEILEEIFLRVTNDYITEVVAHEIGHTLGLRHNFAASMMTNITEETYPHLSRAYFFTGNVPEHVVPGGSVMDYVPLLSGAMIGAHIRLGREILPYDKEAMKYAYTDTLIDEIKSHPFCTDDDRSRGVLKDCLIWDMFPRPFSESKSNATSAINLRGELLALALADADSPHQLSVESIQKAPINPEADAQRIMREDFLALVGMTSDKAEFVTVRHQFPTKLSLSERIRYRNETKQFQQSEIKRLGGLGPYLLSPLEIDAQGELVAKENFFSGFQRSLKRLYPEASQDVKEMAFEIAELYWKIFQAELLRNIPSAFTAQHQFNSIDESWFHSLESLLTRALFSQGGQILAINPEGSEIYNWAIPDQTLTGVAGVRESLTTLVVNDFHKASPSYKRNLKTVTQKLQSDFKLWEKSLIGQSSEDLLSDELYDLLTIERRIFRRFQY